MEGSAASKDRWFGSAHHDKRIAYYARKHFILIFYADCISLDIELCDSWEVAENPLNRVGLTTISFDNEN